MKIRGVRMDCVLCFVTGLFILAVTPLVSGQDDIIVWDAVGFDQSQTKTVFEDDHFNRSSPDPLIHVIWSQSASTCSSLSVTVQNETSHPLGVSLEEEYQPGMREAKFYLQGTFATLIPDTVRIHVTLKLSGCLGKTEEMYVIKIKQVNLNKPIISDIVQDVFSVKENEMILQPLITFVVSDKDMGRGTEMTSLDIKLTDENVKHSFNLEATPSATAPGYNVKIDLLTQLDFETFRSYVLEVQVTDKSENRSRPIEAHVITSKFFVDVEDVHDQNPRFTQECGYKTVLEDSPLGTAVVSVRAVDADVGVRVPNTIKYLLEDEAKMAEEYFQIGKTSGEITVKKKPNLHQGTLKNLATTIPFNITAVEYFNSTHPEKLFDHTTIQCFLSIKDIDNSPPKFNLLEYKATVPEHSNKDTEVYGGGTQNIIDEDQGKNAEFDVSVEAVSDVAKDMFHVTPISGLGEITFSIRVKDNRKLEYDDDTLGPDKTVVLMLHAKGRLNASMTHQAMYTISVTDENDNYPEITSKMTAEIMENSDPGTILTTITASDKDSGDYGVQGLVYRLVSLMDSFEVGNQTGVVTLMEGNKVDREVQEELYLSIEVLDNLGHGNRVPGQIKVTVLDDNDEKPVFQVNNFRIVYNENEGDFQGSVKLEALDKDKPNTENSRVEYHLVNYIKFFSVEVNNGDLKLLSPLNFEDETLGYPKAIENEKSKIASREFKLTTYATDCGQPKQTSEINATIQIQFMDVNDNAPVFDEKLYVTTIEEILKPREPIKVVVIAKDADISTAYNRVYYSLSELSSSNFLVDRTTGELRVAPAATLAPEENEGQGHFNLTVQATDGLSEDDSQDSRCVVMVNVIDVNNQKPTFDETEQIIVADSFEEENPDPVTLAQFVARDVDAGHQLVYNINFLESLAESPQFTSVDPKYDWQSVFEVDKRTGQLTATRADREEMKRVTLVIEAQDVKADPRFPNQIVKLKRQFVVLDVNDHAPDFKNYDVKEVDGPNGARPLYQTEVLENEARPNLFKIEATDRDENQVVTYSLQDYKEAHQAHFTINATTGVLGLQKVDYDEGFHWVNVTVKASDNGIPQQSSLAYVTVKIIDVNDNEPIWEEKNVNYTVERPENEPVGTNIITLKATDRDTGEYGVVNYRFQRDSNDDNYFFDLNYTTGELTNNQILDFDEGHTIYKITVEAFDNPNDHQDSKRSPKTISLHLTDVNDNDPVFSTPSDKCMTCPEDYKMDLIVQRVEAFDKDKGLNAELEYFLDDVENGYFKIERDSGEVKVNGNLTNIPIQGNDPVIKLNITARDKGTPPRHTTKEYCVEVTDINNNYPVFALPLPDDRLKFRKEATDLEPTMNRDLVKVEATDLDLVYGEVSYEIQVWDTSHEPRTEVKDAFTIDATSGLITITRDLKKRDVSRYAITVFAYDNGQPVFRADPIEIELEIISEEDFLPHFNDEEVKVLLNFTENVKPGVESNDIPEAHYRDVKNEERPHSEICYFTVGGATAYFQLDKNERSLTVRQSLDRETHAYHRLIVLARGCDLDPPREPYPVDLQRPDQVELTIKVLDVNDNPPVFDLDPFTGSVTPSSNVREDRRILTLTATDADEGENAIITFSLIGQVESQGAENVQNVRDPFIVGNATGFVNATFNIAKNMKGHFKFSVLAEDIDKLNDKAQVLIYFTREDQQIILTVSKTPKEINDQVLVKLISIMYKVTQHHCILDDTRQYEGSNPMFKNYTNLYVHFVNNETQIVLDPKEAVTLVNRHYGEIETEMAGMLHLVDAQEAAVPPKDELLSEEQIKMVLIGISIVLGLALMVAMTLSLIKIGGLKRNLKAANATAFGSQDSGLNRIGVKSAPNTNQHTVEGSNPMWNQKEQNFEKGSIYGSDTASIQSNEIYEEIIEYENESKDNPAFVNDEEFEHRPIATAPYENENLQNLTTEKNNPHRYKKNTINTLRQIDKDWRRRHTLGEIQMDDSKAKDDIMTLFDAPDPRRPSTFITPIPTTEL